MKKFITLFTIMLFMNLFSVDSVKAMPARPITLNDVAEEIKEQSQYSADNFGITTTDNSLTMFLKDEQGNQTMESTVTFNYSNGIISYEYALGEPLNVDHLFWVRQLVWEIYTAVGVLNGYEYGKLLADDIDPNFTLETNGVEITPVTLNEGVTSDDGVPQEFISYKTFKISIYGLNLGFDPIIPTISLSNVTDKSIDINVKFDSQYDGYLAKNERRNRMCDLYKSTDKEKFEYVGAFNCTGGNLTYTDKNVKPNTTYYYKTAISKTYNYSKVVSAKTKTTVVTTKQEIKNPNTSDPFISIGIILLLLSSIGFLIYNKRKGFN